MDRQNGFYNVDINITLFCDTVVLQYNHCQKQRKIKIVKPKVNT